MPRPPFPKTLRQFQSDFATEEACQQYLTACRWPDGFICPRCGHGKAYELLNQRRQQCCKCRFQVSVTSGTILHRTKIPLTHWFWAAYLMTTDKRGVSALFLQRQLGLICYESTWMMLHKLRRAMVNTSREPLRGEVEVDETWIGGEQAGLRGSRQLKHRRAALVLVAVEKRGQASGRVRMSVIPDFKASTIMSFLTQHVAPGSTIYTDGLKSFSGLIEAGFKHVAKSQPLRSDLRKGSKSAGTARRSGDRESATMADRYSPWSEQGPTPGLPRRICFSAQSSQDTGGRVSDPPWTRNRPQINGLRGDSRREGSQPQPIGAC
jgi:transposase-like protein